VVDLRFSGRRTWCSLIERAPAEPTDGALGFRDSRPARLRREGSENLWLGRVIKNLGLELMVKGGQKQVLQLLHFETTAADLMNGACGFGRLSFLCLDRKTD
jgi:hypothetical protein